MSPVSAVQCNAVLKYCACQSCSKQVHQAPKKIKKKKTEEENSGNRKKEKNKKFAITGQNL